MSDCISRSTELDYEGDVLDPILEKVKENVELGPMLEWIRDHLTPGQVFEEYDLQSYVAEHMQPDDVWDDPEILQEALDRLTED